MNFCENVEDAVFCTTVLTQAQKSAVERCRILGVCRIVPQLACSSMSHGGITTRVPTEADVAALQQQHADLEEVVLLSTSRSRLL